MVAEMFYAWVEVDDGYVRLGAVAKIHTQMYASDNGARLYRAVFLGAGLETLGCVEGFDTADDADEFIRTCFDDVRGGLGG